MLCFHCVKWNCLDAFTRLPTPSQSAFTASPPPPLPPHSRNTPAISRDCFSFFFLSPTFSRGAPEPAKAEPSRAESGIRARARAFENRTRVRERMFPRGRAWMYSSRMPERERETRGIHRRQWRGRWKKRFAFIKMGQSAAGRRGPIASTQRATACNSMGHLPKGVRDDWVD